MASRKLSSEMDTWFVNLAEFHRIPTVEIKRCFEALSKEFKISKKELYLVLKETFQTPPLSSLPFEVRQMIAQGLSTREIVSFCSTSKANIALCASEELWSILLKRDYPEVAWFADSRKKYTLVYKAVFAIEKKYKGKEIKEEMLPSIAKDYVQTADAFHSDAPFWAAFDAKQKAALRVKFVGDLYVLVSKLDVEQASRLFFDLQIDERDILYSLPAFVVKYKAEPEVSDALVDSYSRTEDPKEIDTFLAETERFHAFPEYAPYWKRVIAQIKQIKNERENL